MKPAVTLMLRGLLVACVCSVVLPLSAQASTTVAAKTPCWKTLLNDWYDGRIDNVYPIPCYRSAIQHLPTDVKEYSSAADDIQRALQLAIAHKNNPKAPLPTITASKPPTKKGATGPAVALPGNNPPSGPIQNIIHNSSPGGATSFPLPLIILGGLALFLLAAGAVGLAVRRMQGRGGPGTPGSA